MATLVSLVLKNANRLPLAGFPISNATTWYRKTNENEKPPPPYEKEDVMLVAENSRLTQISDYLWKKVSIVGVRSNISNDNNVINESMQEAKSISKILDKKMIDEAISLIQMATEMCSIKHQHISVDLYMMGLEKLLDSLTGKFL